MGWSYFLQSRAVDPAYTLDEEKISISKPDDRVVIDATSEEYDGKVVYINVTPEMLPALAKAEQFIIRKNPSSVIVLNINGGTNVNEGGKHVLRLAKPSIEKKSDKNKEETQKDSESIKEDFSGYNNKERDNLERLIDMVE